MRVLFADSDRDLLSGYQRLMETEGYTVDTAFDGTQALELLGTGAYDLVILNERLPRAAHGQLMERTGQTPVIVLLDSQVDLRHLCQRKLPEAYLSFPFSPGDLTALAVRVLEKRRSREKKDCMGILVDEGSFRFSGTDLRLTAEEIDLLIQLTKGALPLPFHRRVYVQALNLKLKSAGYAQARVVYEEGKGYRLINGKEGDASE